MRLSEVAARSGTEVLRDGEFRSLGLLCHDLPQMLVMFYDEQFLAELQGNPQIACVITSPQLCAAIPAAVSVAVSEDPMAAFYAIHHHLLTETEFYWRRFATEIAPDAEIHPTAYVAPTDVRIGRNTKIGPRAVILERSLIGDDCVVGPGVVIGGEGFEPKWVAGKHVVVPHAGGVQIHDRAEIQANSHVAKSVFGGFTEIGADTKIDALVHVAHNVRIGRGCEVAASAMIAGSSTIGDQVWVGPSAVICSDTKIGDRAFVAIGSVVLRDVEPGARVMGVPARAR
jgi:UDP-3-O-[3-hydroxymyristoyl] glucosamine N-acyltransferase